jgi:hypothetical protein
LNLLARQIVEESIGERLDGSPLPDKYAGKNPQRSRWGNWAARAAALSPRQRKMIAKKAAQARWKRPSQ